MVYCTYIKSLVKNLLTLPAQGRLDTPEKDDLIMQTFRGRWEEVKISS
jgi:hypothetical protein